MGDTARIHDALRAFDANGEFTEDDYVALRRRLNWNLIGLRVLRQRKAANFGHNLSLRRRGLGLCRQGPGHPFNHNELVGPSGEFCALVANKLAFIES